MTNPQDQAATETDGEPPQDANQVDLRLRVEMNDALRQVATLQAKVQRLQAQKKRLADDLAVITSSRSWRLMAPLRSLSARLRPPGHGRAALATSAPPPPVLRVVEMDQSVWDMTRPLVSVIITDAGRPGDAQATMASIHRQTLQAVETVIAPEDAGGLAAARNAAIAGAQGKYICCLHAGETLDVTYIEKCVTVMEASPNVGFVYSWVRLPGRQPDIWQTEPFALNALMKHNLAPSCSVFRRCAWELVHGFWEDAEAATSDWDFWVSLAEQGWRGRMLAEPLCSQRARSDSQPDAQKRLAQRHERLWAVAGVQASICSGYYEARFAQPFCNLSQPQAFAQTGARRNVLVVVSWLIAGGAETWLYDVLSGVAGQGDIAFHLLTTRAGDNPWHEYLLGATPYIYHLPALLPEHAWLDFVVALARTRQIQTIVLSLSRWGYDRAQSLRALLPAVQIINVLHSDHDVAFFQDSVACDRYVDRHVAVNAHIRDRMLSVYGVPRDKITLVYNGVDGQTRYNPARYSAQDERRRWRVAADKRVVLWMGRFSSEKQPQQFVQVAGDMKERHDLLFLMAGTGALSAAVQQQIASRGLEGRVRLLGDVAAADIAGILSFSDALLVTSVYEGAPRVVLEALAMGVPVIAYDVGIVSDLVHNGINGFVVERARADMLTRRLGELLGDADLLARCKANARATVIDGGFTAQHMVEQWRRLLVD